MESQGPDLIRPFKECQGGWRPDMLLEFNTERNQWNVRENYRICEINARFYWNGSSSLTTGHKVLREMGVGRNGYVEATDPEKVRPGDTFYISLVICSHLIDSEWAFWAGGS